MSPAQAAGTILRCVYQRMALEFAEIIEYTLRPVESGR